MYSSKVASFLPSVGPEHTGWKPGQVFSGTVLEWFRSRLKEQLLQDHLGYESDLVEVTWWKKGNVISSIQI